ncbi:hypothetical protein MAR_011754 [Mya arenaria]|uniref:Uncharacterized protein n=1 Tax=Mya arenaria TaxID=6604 RepID=A0ABY7FV02_MYAAR|nr:hypothetical protein MAR_011754 [Mya arenaria]
MESTVKLEANSTAQVIGPSNVGKSTFVYQLLKHTDGAFTKPIKAIYYCYSVYQPLFADMKKAIPHMTFYEGLPTKTELETWHMNEPREKILVIDDLMIESAKSKAVLESEQRGGSLRDRNETSSVANDIVSDKNADKRDEHSSVSGLEKNIYG